MYHHGVTRSIHVIYTRQRMSQTFRRVIWSQRTTMSDLMRPTITRAPSSQTGLTNNSTTPRYSARFVYEKSARTGRILHAPSQGWTGYFILAHPVPLLDRMIRESFHAPSHLDGLILFFFMVTSGMEHLLQMTQTDSHDSTGPTKHFGPAKRKT